MEVRPVSSERASVFTGGLLVPDRLRSLTSNSFNFLDSIVIAFVLFFSYLSWRRDSSRREYSFGGALDETTISPRDHILTNQ